jgi:quinol monooxygenase YgiN
MLILHVTFHAKPGAREAFVQEVLEAGIAKASEAEQGNYYYDFFFSAENEDDVMLLEKWENQDMLDAHSRQPHYEAIGEIKNKYIVSTDIEKYEIK